MTNPTVAAKVCALSGCSSTSGECYKEGHSHSYSCPSGYDSSCSNGYSGTASKICSCGATSGTCYKCCADTYKYSCSGVGEAGAGTSCNSKYTSCNCASGYTWNGSSCVASCSDTSCKVGHILYSDMTCCKDKLDSKTPIGIVVKYNELALQIVHPTNINIDWANSYIDVEGIVNAAGSYDAKSDYNGRSNTLAIIATHSSDNSGNNAAIYCNEYSTVGTSAGQWYLPAAGEIYDYIYGNYSTISSVFVTLGYNPDFINMQSSSERSKNYAWHMFFSQPRLTARYPKNDGNYVLCFISFNVNNGTITPCNNSYRYACSGVGYSEGVGDTCGGYYTSCNCKEGFEWKNGICTRSAHLPNCSVGMIYYSDRTCSSNYDSSKIPIGVVVKDNELVVGRKNDTDMYWASSNVDVSGLTNYTNSDFAQLDRNGKKNTQLIVSTYSNDTIANNAAKYCNSYSTVGTSAGQWYLPTAGEVYGYIYASYVTLSATFGALGLSLPSGYYWSSSEYNGYRAWVVVASSGYVYDLSKDINYSVSCLLAL